MCLCCACFPCYPFCATEVQIFCKRNDQTATKITKDLKEQLRRRKCKCKIIIASEIDSRKPAILLCFKTSRIVADVSDALADIKPLSTKMALVVLHLVHTDGQNIDGSTELLSGHEEFKNLGMMCDMTYRNDNERAKINTEDYTVYLNNNKNTLEKLASFSKHK